MFNKKKKFIGILSVVLVTLIGFLSFNIFRSNSRDKAIQEITRSIQENDMKLFKEYCSTYTDGKPISDDTIQFFFDSSTKNINEKEVRNLFLNGAAYKIKNEKSWFKKKEFIPKKRFLVCEQKDQTTIVDYISSKKRVSSSNTKGKLGPFIPNKYSGNLLITSPKFGSYKEKIEKDLVKGNGTYSIEENELFLTSNAFQKHLLNLTTDYFLLLNQGIESNLNFEKMGTLSPKLKEELDVGFNQIRPYLERFEHSFQEVILNAESLKISGRENTIVSFDIYIDHETETTFVKEIDDAFSALETRKSAIVTIKYDEKEKKWLIDNVDFKTFAKNPEEWTHIKKRKLNEINQAVWMRDNSDEIL